MSLGKKPPCYNDGMPCPDRKTGCHSKCKEYIEWSQKRNEELADYNRMKHQESEAISQLVERNRRFKRRRNAK